MNETVQLPKIEHPKGEVTIELFDGDTLVQREKSSNFITKGMDFLYKRLAMSTFYGSPLDKMILTNADHAAEPLTEWLIKGDMIGYAFTNAAYAGTDIYRGSINQLESDFNMVDRIHIVVDFPTSAGNGTIESVYFTSDWNSSVVNLTAAKGIKNPFPSIYSVTQYNTKYYAILSPQGYSNDSNILYVYDENFVFEQEIILPDDVIDITAYNGDLYFAGYNNYGGAGITKLPIINLTGTWTQVLTGDYYGIIYDVDNNRFMTNSGAYIKLYDTNFNYLSSNPIDIYFDTDGDYGSSQRVLTYVDGTFIDSRFTVDPSGSMIDRGGGIGIVGAFYDYIVTSSGYLYPKIGFTSRFKLPSPVTKTSTNTMKVTYDFILPSIYDA